MAETDKEPIERHARKCALQGLALACPYLSPLCLPVSVVMDARLVLRPSQQKQAEKHRGLWERTKVTG